MQLDQAIRKYRHFAQKYIQYADILIQYGESGNYVQVEGFVSRPEISKLINYTAPLSKIVAKCLGKEMEEEHKHEFWLSGCSSGKVRNPH